MPLLALQCIQGASYCVSPVRAYRSIPVCSPVPHSVTIQWTVDSGYLKKFIMSIGVLLARSTIVNSSSYFKVTLQFTFRNGGLFFMAITSTWSHACYDDQPDKMCSTLSGTLLRSKWIIYNLSLCRVSISRSAKLSLIVQRNRHYIQRKCTAYFSQSLEKFSNLIMGLEFFDKSF